MRFEPASRHPYAFLDLEYSAWEPYARFVYEDEPQARAIARALFESGFGETAGAHSEVCMDDEGLVAGALTCLSHEALRAARSEAAMHLVRSRAIDPRGPVRERLGLARECLFETQPGDFYLSRIAVDRRVRRRGTGASLLARFIDRARDQGATRLVLEVSPVHTAALAMYQRAGYRSAAEPTVSDPETGRSLKYVHMTRGV